MHGFSDLVDVVCHGDDMQDRAIFSHTCGTIHELIPSLIEVGVDIFNPIHTTARNMQPKLPNREFGKDLVFWGGIDTRQMLQTGNGTQIRDEIR